MREFLDTYWTLEVLVQLIIPIYLLCRYLQRRPTTGVRLLVSMAVLLAIAIVPIATGLVTGLTTYEALAAFSLLLAVFVGLIAFSYDVSLWQALFCATAGYTLQNLASGGIILIEMLLTQSPRPSLPGPAENILTLVVYTAVYAMGYVLFVRNIRKNGLIVAENKLMLLMFIFVIIVIIGIDVAIKGVAIVGMTFPYLLILRIGHASVCVFVLFSEYELLHAKRMSDEKTETERLLAERERQYRLSRENIEAINIKCHDIRHQIRHLSGLGSTIDSKALADIAREVRVYDSVVETGNEALDTILTEKSLACSGEGITLSVIADGAALGFMAPSDIYSLFGNALDNAIEAVRGVTDPERRTITLSVRRRGGMVALNMENHYAHPPRFRDGMPLTTKGDEVNHGFGMRSMRGIVGRYGGTLHVGTDHSVFYLNALIPLAT